MYLTIKIFPIFMVCVSFRHFKSAGKVDNSIFYRFRFLTVHFFSSVSVL